MWIRFVWILLIFSLTDYDINSAFQYLKRGVAHNPDNEELFELAFCYEHLMNMQRLFYYNHISPKIPMREAWFNFWQIYLLTKVSTCADAFEYARVINPDDSIHLPAKAHTHFQMQQYDDALIVFCFEELTG